jgi:hypothetical protein
MKASRQDAGNATLSLAAGPQSCGKGPKRALRDAQSETALVVGALFF